MTGLAKLRRSVRSTDERQLRAGSDVAPEDGVQGHPLSQSSGGRSPPRFFMGCVRRTYVAILSFHAGVIPPVPMLGGSWMLGRTRL
jgi:hypothetical protein